MFFRVHLALRCRLPIAPRISVRPRYTPLYCNSWCASFLSISPCPSIRVSSARALFSKAFLPSPSYPAWFWTHLFIRLAEIISYSFSRPREFSCLSELFSLPSFPSVKLAVANPYLEFSLYIMQSKRKRIVPQQAHTLLLSNFLQAISLRRFFSPYLNINECGESRIKSLSRYQNLKPELELITGIKSSELA